MFLSVLHLLVMVPLYTKWHTTKKKTKSCSYFSVLVSVFVGSWFTKSKPGNEKAEGNTDKPLLSEWTWGSLNTETVSVPDSGRAHSRYFCISLHHGLSSPLETVRWPGWAVWQHLLGCTLSVCICLCEPGNSASPRDGVKQQTNVWEEKINKKWGKWYWGRWVQVRLIHQLTLSA